MAKTDKKTLGQDYINEVSAFEKFLLQLLQSSFEEYRDDTSFQAYLLDSEVEVHEEVKECMDNTLGHFEYPEDDLLCYFDIDEALGNMPRVFADRMHRKGYSPEAAVGHQVDYYLKDRGVERTVHNLYALLLELEAEYLHANIDSSLS